MVFAVNNFDEDGRQRRMLTATLRMRIVYQGLQLSLLLFCCLFAKGFLNCFGAAVHMIGWEKQNDGQSPTSSIRTIVIRNSLWGNISKSKAGR
ncbi:hypothetical protein V6N11_019649 [Hibiscus sabdariffa]|uniref:Uncharacterized protein n=1 Tax=Hibiscus sabdariffa TaxID=183260 RepID=A0ABR2NLC0_9ROSI